MATVQMFFPGGVYPAGFDYNPSLGELIDLTNSTVISSTATRQVIQLQNGLRLELNGTGFTYDAGLNGTGGTLTSIRLLHNNGTTVFRPSQGSTFRLRMLPMPPTPSMAGTSTPG